MKYLPILSYAGAATPKPLPWKTKNPLLIPSILERMMQSLLSSLLPYIGGVVVVQGGG